MTEPDNNEHWVPVDFTGDVQALPADRISPGSTAREQKNITSV